MKLPINNTTPDVFDLDIHDCSDWFYMEEPKETLWTAAVIFLIFAAIAMFLTHILVLISV